MQHRIYSRNLVALYERREKKQSRGGVDRWYISAIVELTHGGPSGPVIRFILIRVDPRSSFFQEADSIPKMGVLNVKGLKLFLHISK